MTYSVLDPFAGGGSIPFEALRYGFTTIANDLNPVAAVILKATLDYPARFGPSLADDIRKWGDIWAQRVKEKLDALLSQAARREYLRLPLGAHRSLPGDRQARAAQSQLVAAQGQRPGGRQLIAEPGMDAPRFEIVTGREAAKAKPDEGTISRGVGRSPWTGQPIDGDYIKAEAQAGRMGQILYAVANEGDRGFEFRTPMQADLDAAKGAEVEVCQKEARLDSQEYHPV